jgi:hypothetical protein
MKHPVNAMDVLLGTFGSVVVSDILCALLMGIYVYCISDGQTRSTPSLTWLPIWIVFMGLLGFPTVVCISYGAGRIVREFTAGSSKTPPGPQ